MVGSTSSQLPDLGFIFYPPKNADSPGYPRLDIILRENQQVVISILSKFWFLRSLNLQELKP